MSWLHGNCTRFSRAVHERFVTEMASFLSGPIFFVSGNLLSSVALILINKRVVSVDRFHFMSVLSGIHFYFSFITCCILLCFGLIRHKPVNNYLHLLRIALVSSSLILLVLLDCEWIECTFCRINLFLLMIWRFIDTSSYLAFYMNA